MKHFNISRSDADSYVEFVKGFSSKGIFTCYLISQNNNDVSWCIALLKKHPNVLKNIFVKLAVTEDDYSVGLLKEVTFRFLDVSLYVIRFHVRFLINMSIS